VTLTHSDQINEIAAALAKAQASMKGAVKDASNPHFKSKYADLASVWEACRVPLTSNGLAVVQSPSAEGATVHLDTLIVHTSGQWIRGTATATAKDAGAQSVGSIITYLRRYGLQSFAGVAPEDDDAEAGTNRNAPAKPALVVPDGYDDWRIDMESTAGEGVEALATAFKGSRTDLRAWMNAHDREWWDGLKAKAAQAVAA
jgi:hypothetical protein